MKLTKAQEEEIDFFAGIDEPPFSPTQEEKEEYINETVHGIKVKGNRISISKRDMDITIAIWREDLVNGLLFIDELYNDEDFKRFSYAKRLIDSTLKSLDFSKWKSGRGFTAISMANNIRKNEICHLKI